MKTNLRDRAKVDEFAFLRLQYAKHYAQSALKNLDYDLLQNYYIAGHPLGFYLN